jgi:hypothetical protein
VWVPLHERAERELKALACQSHDDPDPGQHYEPTAHFAWATREARRQDARRKWEALLP